MVRPRSSKKSKATPSVRFRFKDGSSLSKPLTEAFHELYLQAMQRAELGDRAMLEQIQRRVVAGELALKAIADRRAQQSALEMDEVLDRFEPYLKSALSELRAKGRKRIGWRALSDLAGQHARKKNPRRKDLQSPTRAVCERFLKRV